MRLPRLDPDIAYVGCDLYLPTSRFRKEPLERMLTFPTTAAKDRILLRDHPHHLEVPRNSLTPDVLDEMGIELQDLRPRRYTPVSIGLKSGFGFLPHQIPAWAAMTAGPHDQVLRLDTGRGKTIMGLCFAGHVGGPTLIVSAQGAHLENWARELNALFDFRGRVGWVDSKRMDWKAGIVLCTVQTLARKAREGKLPLGFASRFALVIFDEVHHQAAEWFCTASNITAGRRLGLTATLKRRDRCEGIITAHIGGVVYDDPAEDALIPTVWVHETGTDLDDDPGILDCLEQPNVSRMRSRLGEMPHRNTRVINQVLKRLKEGHKVYLLGHIRRTLDRLVQDLKGRGVSVGYIRRELGAVARLEQLAAGDVTVATVHIGKENYNRKDLSALVAATPFGSDDHASTEWIQAVGRILRPLKGKPDPVIDLFMDSKTSQSRGLTYAVLAWCRRQKWPVKGDTWRRTRTTWKV